MTEDCHFKSSPEPLCIPLYLGLNPRPLSSYVSVLPTSPQWQIFLDIMYYAKVTPFCVVVYVHFLLDDFVLMPLAKECHFFSYLKIQFHKASFNSPYQKSLLKPRVGAYDLCNY